MASQSFYRKWRSQTFSDLIGQDAVTRTLLNAVRGGRLAHAYLFCGPRGTGKTSTARLLAKAVNCANPHDGEPCNECVSCREITAGHSPDVIEIDAASNTGVDNIRDLRENANLLGSGGHFKVYVVDECFSYGELVSLADGTKEPIGKLVESQWQGEVLSYNTETGQIEPKRIVRHMRKQTSVPTIRVTFDNNRSIVCTINHRFYTPQGKVCAGHLAVGQFVYTNRERITQRQRAVIMGAALGDGHLALTGSAMRGRLSMTHGVTQKDYLDYKVQLLGNLVRSKSRFDSGVGTYSKTGTYRATTLSRPEIAQIRHDLYGEEKKKRISRTYLEQLDELGLALWYLDDGSLITAKYRYKRVGDGGTSVYSTTRSTLSMYGFPAADVREVCLWLQERWGVESRITVTAKGPMIWLTVSGTQRLHEIIALYTPPVMQYKLLPDYRGRFQEPMADDGIQSGLAVSVVRAITPIPMPEFVYNIEVADNHNYFVRDMLVANCHMLSVSAFNALLKTLEEPPPHVIFVLATTEAHKVLPTVVSRCQRFDFRRFTMRDLVARLEHVAQGEALTLEPAAAELLARAAQGGMRDALSLLDQAVAFCGDQITYAGVRAMLGLADATALRALIGHVAARRAAEGLDLINDLVASGADLRQLNSQLIEEWRALMLARAGADVARLMDRTDEDGRELTALAAQFTLDQLMTCARIFTRNEGPARGLPIPQLALELVFLECVSVCDPSRPAVVVEATRAPHSNAALAAPIGGAAPTAHPPSTYTPSASSPSYTPAYTPSAPGAAPTSVPMRPAAPTPAPRASAPPPVATLDLASIDRGEAPPVPPAPSSAAPARPATAPAASSAGNQGDDEWGDTSEYDDPGAWDEIDGASASPASAARSVAHDQPASGFDDATPVAPAASAPAEPVSSAGAVGRDWLTEAQNHWTLIKKICKQRPGLGATVGALLSHAYPILMEPEQPGEAPTIILQAKYKFHAEGLRDPAKREIIEWALEQALEAPVRVRVVQEGMGVGPGVTVGRGAPAPTSTPISPPRSSPPSAPISSAAYTSPRAPTPPATERRAGGEPTGQRVVREGRDNYTPSANSPASQNGNARTGGGAGARPAASASSQRALEEQARADPVVQELARLLGAEVAEVRSLDTPDDDAPDVGAGQ